VNVLDVVDVDRLVQLEREPARMTIRARMDRVFERIFIKFLYGKNEFSVVIPHSVTNCAFLEGGNAQFVTVGIKV
jgi:hypothetical protein